MRNLARALGWPFEEKQIFVHPEWREGKPRVRPSLEHVDLAHSDSLEGPWPDLVMSAGRRLSSVALWIKASAREAGVETRTVLVGKPRRFQADVDLAVVAAHYTLAEGPNVIRHDLPFMQVEPDALAEAKAVWEPKLAAFKRPLVALLVGGRTGGLHFDESVAERLMQQTRTSVERHDGSLFVTTSRRTPRKVVAVIERMLPAEARLWVFDPDASPAENPYHGLLALADHVIATTDSISMMVEAVRVGRSLSLFPLASELGPIEAALGRLGVWPARSPREHVLPAGGASARLLDRIGMPRHSRDLSAIPRRLVELGLASWLDEEASEPLERKGPYVDEALEVVAARIRELVAAR